ncbi:MAG: bacterial transcriptional activator domain-containing protein, partial [Coriobacteriales bacterium]|nr:bacterial transcriptional activator domain-containing protein [Coriobacteriales bacterium]
SGGNDEFVVGHQQRFRSLMVDAMLTASQLFAEMGNLSNAVWFARKAYDSDRSREDVYRALMDAQMKSGQRTSALKTYFACKKYLTEELGILPSQSTTALFQTLIQDKD